MTAQTLFPGSEPGLKGEGKPYGIVFRPGGPRLSGCQIGFEGGVQPVLEIIAKRKTQSILVLVGPVDVAYLDIIFIPFIKKIKSGLKPVPPAVPARERLQLFH